MWGFPVVLVVKNLPASAGDVGTVGQIPGQGISSGEGNGNSLQYSFFFFFSNNCLSRLSQIKKKIITDCSKVFLPGELHGQRSVVGCSSWGHKESDTTEQLSSSI